MRSQRDSGAVMDESVVSKGKSSNKAPSLHPSLYQINTRVLLLDLTKSLGHSATLDDIPDADLDRMARQNFDWIWFLGVWQTGLAGRKVSRAQPEWQEEFRHVLPELTEEDICGSCFAITHYEVNTGFGGNAALERLRARLHTRGLKLLLDFVPNHTALDHPWVRQHPEFYVHGTQEQLQHKPQNYVSLDVGDKRIVFAYGRDPYFPGWPDTLQLNYAEPSLQKAMLGELQKVADRCDGIRCDMAMLILPDVFERTWGKRPQPFWPRTINSIRSRHPEFVFMAEVYWDLEWTLQQQGFDYTYDKRLYDRLREGQARPVRDHFQADIKFQMRSARFLENHDEPRAAASFPRELHRAAAVLTFFCPGLRFLHDGQFEGRTKKVSVHLGRRQQEPLDSTLSEFYEHLLACMNLPCVRDGAWQLLNCLQAWEGNWTYDCFVCFAWNGPENDRVMIAVNYAPNQSQCYVRLPFEDLMGKPVRLEDLMGHSVFERDGSAVASCGLYLDMPAWGYHVFRVTKPTVD